MRIVKPRVFLLAETQVDYDGYDAMLKELGLTHESDASTGSESLIECMGRLCYRSFGDGEGNPNITRTRKGNANYIKNILESRHGSVLEHGTVTFAFINVTRVFTHELVRHRVGTAFSQESLRFVRLTDLGFVYPSAFEVDLTDEQKADVRKTAVETVQELENVQKRLTDIFKMDNKSFSVKKIITSALRRLAPIGLATNIGVTGNHREWRHIIEQRCSPSAEEEIRLVISDVAQQLKSKFPNIYQDMHADGEGAWRFDNSRI